MKNLSDNTLQEMLCYLYRTKNSLNDDFLHIEGHISLPFKSTMDKQINKIEKELESRGF